MYERFYIQINTSNLKEVVKVSFNTKNEKENVLYREFFC